jgi:hypothetical protein
MGIGGWLRALEVVGGLARRGADREPNAGVLAPFETHLLGFAIGAIKKAFDRDSDRMALERQHLEAERARAEAALRLEWLRQEADRRFTEARLVAGLAFGVWIASAILGVTLAGGYALLAKVLLASAWTALIGSMAIAMIEYRRVTSWVTVAATSPTDPPARTLVAIALSLLIAGFALSSASLLAAL